MEELEVELVQIKSAGACEAGNATMDARIKRETPSAAAADAAEATAAASAGPPLKRELQISLEPQQRKYRRLPSSTVTAAGPVAGAAEVLAGAAGDQFEPPMPRWRSTSSRHAPSPQPGVALSDR